MTVASLAARRLTIDTPGGRLTHPVDDTTVCAVIRRLAPILPPATWSVHPGRNRGKIAASTTTQEAADGRNRQEADARP